MFRQRRYSHPVDKSTGAKSTRVRSNQTVILASPGSADVYPDSLRRVSDFDAITGKRLVFLSNNFTLPDSTTPQIYKKRWEVEFFSLDQAALTRKGILRNRRERGEHLRPGRHHPQTKSYRFSA